MLDADMPHKKSRYFINAALAVNEEGLVSVICEAGLLGSEPTCVILSKADKRLEIMLSSGDILQMSETIRENILPTIEKAKRVLLMEAKNGAAECGYVIPILQRHDQTEGKRKVLAAAG